MFGPIRPLRPLGEGELRLDPERLTFGGLELSLADLRYVTTERADTLQLATAAGMWQFRPTEGSAFRLKNALDQWRGAAGTAGKLARRAAGDRARRSASSSASRPGPRG